MSEHERAAQAFIDCLPADLPYGARATLLDAFNKGWEARGEADDE